MAEYLNPREYTEAKFSDLLGLTLIEVKGMEPGSGSVTFRTIGGSEFLMFHDRECCESVTIESVVGDIADLVGTTLLLAEESISREAPTGLTNEYEYEPDSQTWTFYKLATAKGYVDIRWFGESNGYYSESVDFVLRRQKGI